ncbi:hypothetical protein K2X30_00020 [bacterium]|nr:hypothetical protein [bacterium]
MAQRSLKKLSPAAVLTLGISLLGLNLFFIGPALSRVLGVMPGNIAFVVIRVATLIAVTAVLSGVHKRNRFQTISAGAFIEFFDHVVFRGFFWAMDMRAHPEVWGKVGPMEFAMGLLSGFVLFFPLILLLSFLGSELGLKLFKKR